MASSSSAPSKDSTSLAIKTKLLSLNDELVRLEYTYSVYVVNPVEEEQEEAKRKEEEEEEAKGKEEEAKRKEEDDDDDDESEETDEEEEEVDEQALSQQRQKLISDVNEWNLKTVSYIKDRVTPFFTTALHQSYKTLKLLHRFLNYNLLSRSEALRTMILHPNQQQEDDEEKDGRDVSKTVFKKTVFAAKGIVSEIRISLANLHSHLQQLLHEPPSAPSSVKMTLDEISEKRFQAVLAGVQLSKLLAQFVFSLSARNNEAALEKLQLKIKKLVEDNIVATKFFNVIEETKDLISKQQEQQRMKNKEKEVAGDEKAVDEHLIKQFCRGICDLEFFLCGENIPEETKMVNGARVKMEVVLGLMLYQMQGIRIMVGKNNHGDDHDSWKMIKTVIANLWDIERYI
ncbi:hypothetical protein PIB30_026219 [Stylosanthes scabra]|uniref:Uncharacterized protein n=1 Tax=Stylosanthes scabra TaxID=79078 RepID=A0ABU6Z726_9FABA|nr:hypothetical protein [Stylosanthes scabra]